MSTVEVETVEPAALSVKGTCAYLALGRRAIYELIAADKLHAKKAGAKTLIDYQSAKTYYASLPAAVIGASIPNAPQVVGASKRRRRTGKAVRS
jgi:excisionase family DNA binding protein